MKLYCPNCRCCYTASDAHGYCPSLKCCFKLNRIHSNLVPLLDALTGKNIQVRMDTFNDDMDHAGNGPELYILGSIGHATKFTENLPKDFKSVVFSHAIDDDTYHDQFDYGYSGDTRLTKISLKNPDGYTTIKYSRLIDELTEWASKLDEGEYDYD